MDNIPFIVPDSVNPDFLRDIASTRRFMANEACLREDFEDAIDLYLFGGVDQYLEPDD